MTIEEYFKTLELTEYFTIAGAIVTIALFGVYKLIWPLLEKPFTQNKNKVRIIIGALIILLIALFSGGGMATGYENWILSTPTYTLFPTRVSTNTPTLTLTNTSTITTTVTVTPTPPPDIGLIRGCTPPYDNLPCMFTPTESKFNSSTAIANEVYGNYQYAGRIAELLRDENGLIKVVSTGGTIVIPDINTPRTEEYFLYYLNKVLGLNFYICDESNIKLPCILTVEEYTDYRTLANTYYSHSDDSIIQYLKRANDIEFFWDEIEIKPELQPITNITIGTIIVIPKDINE